MYNMCTYVYMYVYYIFVYIIDISTAALRRSTETALWRERIEKECE